MPGSIAKMLVIFPSKSIRLLRLIHASKFLNSKSSYSTLTKIVCFQRIYHLTLKTSTSQKLYFTNKSNNFTNITGEEGGRNLNANYDDVLQAQSDHNVLIIDVREESEIKETGKLPGSIHIPMADVGVSLTNLSNEEFEEKYNKKKPTHDTKIILSCKSGRRSALVQSSVQKLGYKNAFNYTGGWLDWENKQKV